MQKIKKIDINNFGSYKNYNWNSAVSTDAEFKDVNIIYGRNYTGKTTLSRIFKCLEKKSVHSDYENPNFTFTLDDSSTIQNSTLHTSNLDVSVYNTDFVKDNLNWLHNQDGSIEPFTVLGGDNNLIEAQVIEIKSKLGDKPEEEKENPNEKLYFDLVNKAEKYKASYDLHKKLKDVLEVKLRNKANQEIKHNKLYGNPNYRINSIKHDIETVKKENIQKLDNETVKKYDDLIKEVIKNDIKTLPEQKTNFEKYYLEVKEILNKKIKPSNPIQELLDDSLLQEWVRQGRTYHESKRESCAFCGNFIDENLWKKLDEHFSKESELLRVEIQNKIDELDKKKSSLETFISFNESDFYSTSQEDIKESLKKWNNLKLKYRDNIELLITALKSRGDDIFNHKIEIETISDISDDILECIKDINKLIEVNNKKSLTLNKEQSDARDSLRLSEISRFIEDIDYDKKIDEIKQAFEKEESFKKDKEDLDRKIKQYEEEIRQLQTQLNDESKGAELVNEYLEKYFGSNGFKLVPNDEGLGVKYKIVRDGQEAKNLSEGECSLISFCYFMAKIKDALEDDVNPNNLIIYIDDPISSLDSNHIFFIFSLIEHKITKPKKYKQLFISTHSLDFLKYIKRLTVPGDKKEVLRHFLIEMEQKQNDKRSNLKCMPDYLRDYTTEFNYLFNEIYKLYKEVRGERARQIENTYNQFYNIPNNIRKFLEYYLFYKYPNSDSPLNNLDKLFDGEIPTKINRIVNELSHLTFIDRGWSPMDVSEIEECVKIVIEKVKDKDEDQFNALVQSVQ